MRDPQQQAERVAGKPPEGRAETDHVEQPRKRFRRHNDEGGEGNGHDIGAGTIQAGAVEVEDRDRRQRRLYDQPGQQ